MGPATQRFVDAIKTHGYGPHTKGVNLPVLTAWCDVLESGEYRQGHGSLNHCGGFCCLGVLADGYVRAFPKKFSWDEVDFFEWDKYSEGGVLPSPLRDATGLSESGVFNEDAEYIVPESAKKRLRSNFDFPESDNYFIPSTVETLIQANDDVNCTFAEISQMVRAILPKEDEK